MIVERQVSGLYRTGCLALAANRTVFTSPLQRRGSSMVRPPVLKPARPSEPELERRYPQPETRRRPQCLSTFRLPRCSSSFNGRICALATGELSGTNCQLHVQRHGIASTAAAYTRPAVQGHRLDSGSEVCARLKQVVTNTCSCCLRCVFGAQRIRPFRAVPPPPRAHRDAVERAIGCQKSAPGPYSAARYTTPSRCDRRIAETARTSQAGGEGKHSQAKVRASGLHTTSKYFLKDHASSI